MLILIRFPDHYIVVVGTQVLPVTLPQLFANTHTSHKQYFCGGRFDVALLYFCHTFIFHTPPSQPPEMLP